jgi:hypothetical protein
MKSANDKEMVSVAFHCDKCNTDAQIEEFRFDSKTALVMTRWINLGQGRTKEDPLWKSRAQTKDWNRVSVDRDDPEHFHMGPSPRRCFEDSAPRSFEDLRFRNFSYLKDQNYKNGKPFIAARQELWHTPYNERSGWWGMIFT